MEKMKISMCLSMAVIAMLASASLAASVAPADDAAAVLTVMVGEHIDITIEGDIGWPTVGMNVVNWTPFAAVENYWVRVMNTTTVVVDIGARADNINAPVGLRDGMYAAVTGPDNNIDDIRWWSAAPGTPGAVWVDIGTHPAILPIPWMENIPVPGAGMPATERNAFPRLTTAVNQVGGSYRGVLTVRAVQDGQPMGT
jgi:hypothetical protein